MIHDLKILPEFFNEVLKGNKNFEIRKFDRDFKVGDFLNLKEFVNDNYTSREITVKVKYILPGGQYGIDSDYCVMSIELV